MDYRNLGDTGLMVSPICLGTMMFGGQADEATSKRIIAAAFDAGVNFIDVADGYVKGESERIVGRAIKRRRDDWVVTTKAGNPFGPGPNDRGLGAKHLLKSIDGSLKRLGTDYVDIFYFHLDDYGTPMEESVQAAADMVRAGKARYWGVSNYFGWRIAAIASLAASMGAPMPAVCQPYYNAMNRMPESEVLPACEYFGMGVVPYSPLARGVLTGKYAPDKAPTKGSRAGRNDPRMMQTEFRAESLKMAQKIKKHAEKRGMTAGQFALLWVLNNRLVSSVLAGPRTMDQWKQYIGALDHAFTAKDEALIDKMVPSGHPSTPGYSDPKYPYQGRPTWTE